MKCRHNRLICCIIAIFILFSGMCVEQPAADSLFVCAENISSGSYISSSKGMLSRYELTTAELMGTATLLLLSVMRSVRFWGLLIDWRCFCFWQDCFCLGCLICRQPQKRRAHLKRTTLRCFWIISTARMAKNNFHLFCSYNISCLCDT